MSSALWLCMDREMSFEASDWCWKLPLPRDMKGILARLCHSANGNRETWLSINRLAIETGWSKWTVRSVLLRLKGIGLVAVAPPTEERRTATVTVNIGATVPLDFIATEAAARSVRYGRKKAADREKERAGWRKAEGVQHQPRGVPVAPPPGASGTPNLHLRLNESSTSSFQSDARLADAMRADVKGEKPEGIAPPSNKQARGSGRGAVDLPSLDTPLPWAVASVGDFAFAQEIWDTILLNRDDLIERAVSGDPAADKKLRTLWLAIVKGRLPDFAPGVI